MIDPCANEDQYEDGQRNPAGGRSWTDQGYPVDHLTTEEWFSLTRRRFFDCIGRMAGSPFYALVGGSAVVTCFGALEASLYIKPTSSLTLKQRLWFIGSYSFAQIIPSIVWNTQPPCTIAQTLHLDPLHFYKSPLDAPALKTIRLKALQSVRGAVAGSIILSQVLSLMTVVSVSQTTTAERIRSGREPPLEDDSRRGVVVRLAGPDSPLTRLSMARDGRRHIFPILEDQADELVQVHASPRWSWQHNFNPRWSQYFPSIPFPFLYKQRIQLPQVPVYWHVEDGKYSHLASWENLTITHNWLLTTSHNKRLLYLEADATSGTSRAMSLRRIEASELDLDLYEVAQGFTQLQRLVQTSEPFDTLRVLLVDAQAALVSGSGRRTTVREYASELDLADVIVDARAPLLHVMTDFVRSLPSTAKVVVLETPTKEWFDSIKTEVKRATGFTVMDRFDALESSEV